MTAAPDNLIAQITDAWKKTLKLDEVAEDADFFELGGDSFAAINLFLEIEALTGQHLELTAIYDAPTIAAQAAMIRGEIAPTSSVLVLLREGHGAPVFIVHGIGGTVMELSELARHIPGGNPIYGIQARGLDGKEPPLESIEEMAALYVEAARTLQPRGPYLFAGYSFGGLVVREMARLVKETEGIDIVPLMIDSYGHPHSWPLWVRIEAKAREYVIKARHRCVHAMIVGLARLQGRPAPAPKHRFSWPFGGDENLPRAVRIVNEAATEALRAYRPQPHAGDVVFVKARKIAVFYPLFARAIWQHRVRRFELHVSPGHHISMLRENVGALAAHVGLWIAQQRFAQRLSAGERDATTILPRFSGKGGSVRSNETEGAIA